VTDLMARLSAPIAGAAASLADGVAPEVALERPGDPSHGDFATTIALRLAPILRRAPRQIAEEIASRIRDGRDYAAVEVAGAGFVNVRLAPAWFHDAVAEIAAAGDRYGAGRPDARRNVLVELVSANPTGDVTVASARNGAYGDSVARLVEFAGHEVVREYYFNDAGGQVDKFGASVRAKRRGEEMPEGGYPGEVVDTLATMLDVDPEASVEEWTAAAVTPMFDRIRASLERLRIHVDIWFSERELHASGAVDRAIGKARAAGHVYERDGATWLATSQFGDDKDRVLIKSDGTPAYFAADLAYIEHKFARGHDRLIYILGADHHGYVARLRAAAACMGYDPNAVEVPIYQMVTVSGERMGKRRGNVVTADELVEAIGVDATRFFLVQRSHDQTMDIDLDLAVRQERENPVYYVQYAHARAQSILRRAASEGHGPTAGPWTHAPEAQERELVKRLVEWPAVATDAAERRAPHRVIAYALALAADFHVFHHDLRVLHDDPDVRAFRLTLTAAVGSTVKRALDLVGATAPDTM
jgi:arginyl-tRNA synthetase